MLDITTFLQDLPTVQRERQSDIKNALENGKIYISLIYRNEKAHFKLYTDIKEKDTKKAKQVKATPEVKEYIKSNLANVVLSKKAEDFLDA